MWWWCESGGCGDDTILVVVGVVSLVDSFMLSVCVLGCGTSHREHQDS